MSPHRRLDVVPECDGREEEVHRCRDCKHRRLMGTCDSPIVGPPGTLGGERGFCSIIRMYSQTGRSCDGFEPKPPGSLRRLFGRRA